MANVLSWLTGREDNTGQPQPFVVNDRQPSLRAYHPSPTERVGNWIQDLLMAGGAKAYPAGHVAHGVRDLLSMSPLGIGMSAADVLHAKSAGDPMGAAAAAIGMVPGLKPEVQAVRQGIRAYHGSPHDFEKFDISKIGSGEGAQAYGHGLYFAENEKVARGYRDALADHDYKNPQTAAAAYLEGAGGNYEDAIAKLKNHVTQPFWGSSEEQKAMREALVLLNNRTKLPELGQPGKMYEVNINAKPEQFLDWDRSLRDQPQAVQDVTKDLYSRRMPSKDPNDLPKAGDAYQRLGNYTTPREVSQNFAEAGIPGIRYLDQGSRNNFNKSEIEGQIARIVGAHGEQPSNPAIADMLKGYRAQLDGLKNQTSNYVLFNDQLVDIMRKYGLAAPAAAGAASYAMQPQEARAAKAQPAQFQPPAPLSDRINQMIDSLQWGDQWQGRMRLPLQTKVNSMLGESVWPPMR